MELRQLRYFEALTGTLHFTRAAGQMHVSQSTLSQQIRKLEEELGALLFDRVGRRVRLTAAGRSLLDHVNPALQMLDQGMAAVQPAVEQLETTVRFGTTHSFNMQLVPTCVAAFIQRHPQVHVIVEEASAEDILGGVASEALDFGIAFEPPADAGLWFELLFEEEMVLAVKPDHPLAGRRRVRMVELNRRPLVMLPMRFRTRQALQMQFAEAGVRPQVAVEVSAIAPMLELVRRTGLAAIVSRSAIDGSPGLVSVSIEQPVPTRALGIIWKTAVTQRRVVKEFAAIIRTASRAMAGKDLRTPRRGRARK